MAALHATIAPATVGNWPLSQERPPCNGAHPCLRFPHWPDGYIPAPGPPEPPASAAAGSGCSMEIATLPSCPNLPSVSHHRSSRRRRRLLIFLAAAALPATSLPARARGLFQMPPPRLSNRYFLVRAGESEYERVGVVNTNPVAKTSVDSGLSEEGKRQTVRSARQLQRMGACDASCWIWPSITQRSYQAAEIIATVNGVDRSRIVPEYSFLDARGLGAYEGGSLDSISEVRTNNTSILDPRGYAYMVPLMASVSLAPEFVGSLTSASRINERFCLAPPGGVALK